MVAVVAVKVVIGGSSGGGGSGDWLGGCRERFKFRVRLRMGSLELIEMRKFVKSKVKEKMGLKRYLMGSNRITQKISTQLHIK